MAHGQQMLCTKPLCHYWRLSICNTSGTMACFPTYNKPLCLPSRQQLVSYEWGPQQPSCNAKTSHKSRWQHGTHWSPFLWNCYTAPGWQVIYKRFQCEATVGQMLKCQRWLCLGLMRTICYPCAMYIMKSKFLVQEWYSAQHGFFSLVKGLVEPADRRSGCGQVAWDGCLFAWNLSVTWSAILMEAERRTRPNMTLLLH
jgi:hypothetical protein